MTISIIIPAHNEEKYLEECLKNLLCHRHESVLEIIVVDNASTDRTAQIARAYPGVKVVSEPTKGLTHARQRGLQEARGTHLAYIDADTLIQEHWFPMIERTFAENPNLVALSGPYRYYDLPRWQRILVRWYWNFFAAPASRFVAVMVGGNFVAKKEALEAIGGFDTRIAFYGEDTNIARRLKRVGAVRFSRRFFIHSSGRRLAAEGIAQTGWTYVTNFLSETILRRPLTKRYTDIR